MVLLKICRCDIIIYFIIKNDIGKIIIGGFIWYIIIIIIYINKFIIVLNFIILNLLDFILVNIKFIIIELNINLYVKNDIINVEKFLFIL